VGYHIGHGAFVLPAVLLFPASVLLFFAWSSATKQGAVQVRQPNIFGWGLLSATFCTCWFFAWGVHYFRTNEPAHSFWLYVNWVAILMWTFGLSASFTGRGAARIFLICWGLLLFLGVCGIDALGLFWHAS